MKKAVLMLLSWTAAACILSPYAVLAEKRPYVLDRSHCQLNFIGEALLISAHGFFERWEGDVQIDRENLENSSLTLTIDAASLNTRVERRDNHLRSPDFFDVAKYPQIKFVSTKIAKVDDKNLNVAGELTLRGVTKPIQAPVKVVFLREGDARFKGEFQLNRKDFGMTYNSKMNPIEDMVTVQFDLHLQDKEAFEKRQREMQQQPRR
jgi:polyisoprenoid-binding protein YceI